MQVFISVVQAVNYGNFLFLPESVHLVPDNVEDMAEAKEVLGPYMCIQGNVPPVEVMRLGTPYDVLRASRESIRKAYDSPKGFVLTSGCQTPMFTPEENMTALMDAARIFGHYPINQDLLWMED